MAKKTKIEKLEELSPDELFDAFYDQVCNTIYMERDHKYVKDIILAGLDVNTKDDIGNTPLHWAAKADDSIIVKLILDAGGDPNTKNHRNVIPLCDAVVSCGVSSKVIELLITAGSDLESRDEHGYTPLHYAGVNGKKYAAIALLAAGADPKVKDVLGRTPHELSCMWSQYGISELNPGYDG